MKTTILFLTAVCMASATALPAQASTLPNVANQVSRSAAQSAAGQIGAPGWGPWAYGAYYAPWWCCDSFWFHYPYSYFYGSYNYPLNQYAVQGVSSQPSAPTAITKATVQVYLPADAELWINGEKNVQSGTFRSFETKSLGQGQTLNVVVRATWKSSGKEVSQSLTLAMQAGNQRILNFMGE